MSDDPLVSGNHCELTNGFALDNGSTNGTSLNGAPLKVGVKKMLKAGDKLQVGDRILRIETGAVRQASGDQQDLSRSKKFIGGVVPEGDKKDDASASAAAANKESDEDAKLSVEELMDKEFARIIGHDGLKKQLRQFYKKVQLDQIRIKAGKEKDAKRLYHMIFSGPPGTGQPRALAEGADCSHSFTRLLAACGAMCVLLTLVRRSFLAVQARRRWRTWCPRS